MIATFLDIKLESASYAIRLILLEEGVDYLGNGIKERR
jgi:hypothetical protein